MSEERKDEHGRDCRICQVWLSCEVINALDARAKEEGTTESLLLDKITREYLGLPQRDQ